MSLSASSNAVSLYTSQRKIVDQREYQKKVSPVNKVLIRDFLIEKKAQNKTSATLIQYENNAKIILTMLYRHFDNKELTKLTRKDIRNLSIIFQDREMSNARVNSLLSTLRSALEYFADDDELEDYEFNVGSRVKGLPKNPVREITFLSEQQIHWVKNELLKKKKVIQALYLMLSYTSAARKNEVYQVLKEDLLNRFYTNTVIGKRRKKFKLYYNEEVRQLMFEYLNLRGDDDIPQLFVKIYKNGKKEVIHPATFNAWCDEMSIMLSEHEGKEIHVNPHCFRHSRLENLSRNGIPLNKLKALANHNDISTTESYLADRSEDDIAEIFGMDASLFK